MSALDSPHIVALQLGLSTADRPAAFGEAVTALIRARAEAAREGERLNAAREVGRTFGAREAETLA